MSSPLPTHLSTGEKEMLEHARVRKHLADVTAESSSSATNGNGDRLEAQFRAGERFRQAIGKATWYFDDLGAMLREKVRDGN